MSGTQAAPRELFLRHARKDGRSVAVLRAYEGAGGCHVESEVFSTGGGDAHHSTQSFADVRTAVAFVTEAVEALMYLGCDVQAE